MGNPEELVAKPVREKFQKLCEKFNQQYYGLPESTAEKPPVIPVPVERVLLASHSNLSTVSFLGQSMNERKKIFSDSITSSGEIITVVCSQQTVLISGSSGKTSLFTTPSCVTGGVVLLSPDRMLLYTDSGVLLYSINGTKLGEYTLGNKLVVRAARVTDDTVIVTTADHAVYILTIQESKELSISHQLMIAPSDSSLGKIFQLSLSTTGLLAIVGSAAVLILDLAIVDQPKLLFKKVRKSPLMEEERGLWLGEKFLIPKRGTMFVPTAEGFETKTGGSELASWETVIPISENVVALVKQGKLTLGEIAGHNDIKILTSEELHALPNKGDCELLVPPGSQSIVVVSLRSTGQNTVTVDVHCAQVVRWMEHVFSLSHSEKFCIAISLLFELVRGEIPLLMDSRETLADPTVIVGLVAKFAKSPQFTEELPVRLSAACACLEEVADIFDSPALAGRKKIFFDDILELVVRRVVPTTALTQQVVMRTIDVCLSHPLIDDFIAVVIVRGGDSGEVLVDTNQIVRIATARDFQKSIVLIHSYLLNDHLFPLKYWMLADRVDMDEVCYYMHCLSAGRKFPCMELPFLEGSSVLKSLVQEETQLFEKLFFRDPETVVESIGFEFPEYVKILASQHPDLKDVVSVYCTKCAVAKGEKIDAISALPNLIAKHELDLILQILEGESGSMFSTAELMSVFKKLLNQDPSQIVRFAMKFELPVDQCVDACMQVGKDEVALRLLVKTKDTEGAVKLIHDEKEFAKKVDMAVWVTPRWAGKEKSLSELWTKLLGDAQADLLLERVDVKAVLAGAVNVFALAEIAQNLKLKTWLMSIEHSRHQILKQAAVVSAQDVGKQFVVLANANSVKNRGISVTASICHSCLDPITTTKQSKRNELLLFSCGHIVHSACGDRTGCPVCV